MKHCCVFTICKNESFFLPIWLKYYRKHFADEDIYIIDHDSDDGSTTNLNNINIIPVHHNEVFDHDWLLETVKQIQRELLLQYAYVLFVEVDEIVVTSPESNMSGGLREYIDKNTHSIVRATGYNIMDNGKLWVHHIMYNKPVLSKVQLNWNPGFHSAVESMLVAPDPHLYLFHLRNLDYNEQWKRTQKFHTMKFNQFSIQNHKGVASYTRTKEQFDLYWEQSKQGASMPPGWVLNGDYFPISL